VYYAIRALLAADIPMNDGVFRPIDVRVPEGTLLNPHRPAPVSAGNVETSMRNADLVLAALGMLAPERVPAQSGGSMNNVMMGGIDERGAPWAFYETNGCGMGARPAADGVDAIQAHMTNTLNTPIEALEAYYPMRVTEYRMRRGSGGPGQFAGGDGLVREIECLVDSNVSLLTERRVIAPWGLAGGGNGRVGANSVVRKNGRRSKLPGKTNLDLAPGDRIRVETPGGGAWGRAPSSKP
jgi:N-methylhydantoinase B